MSRASWQLLLALLLICGVGVAAYSNTLHVPFVFDDEDNIVNNRNIRIEQFDRTKLKGAAFKGPSRTRPVANISFALNHYFGINQENQEAGYHAANLIIHLTSGLLVYFVVLSTLRLAAGLKSQKSLQLDDAHLVVASLAAACIFVAHPVQTQSVTYIVQRMTSMAAMFYLAALLAYILGRKTQVPSKRWTFWAAGFLFWILALGTKQNAAILPFIVIFYEWFFFQDLDVRWLRRGLGYLAGATVIAGLLVVLYLGQAPLEKIAGDYTVRDFSMGQRVLTQPRVVVFYMTLLVCPFPSRLNLIHNISTSTSLVDPSSTWIALLAIVGFMLLAIYLAPGQRLVCFAILWFFGNLVMESSVVSLEMIFEHRLYLPMFSFALVISYLFALSLGRYRRMGLYALAIYVLMLTAGAHLRNSVWEDEVSLWSDVLAKNSQSHRALVNRGNAYRSLKQSESAYQDYLEAIELKPDYASALYNLGLVFVERKYWDKAKRMFEKVIRINPAFSDAHYNLGVACLREEEPLEATRHFKNAISHNRYHVEALNNLGLICAGQGNYEQAVQYFYQAYLIQPNSVMIQRNLAAAIAKQRDAAGGQ